MDRGGGNSLDCREDRLFSGSLAELGPARGKRHRQPSTAFLFQAVRLAFDVDRGGVMQQAIEDRARDHGIAEDLAPRTEALIAGQEDRAPLVATRDELEEEIRPGLEKMGVRLPPKRQD